MTYSFVVPVYDTEPYLPRCLDSILAQADKDFEVIVVDDCSPGKCEDIVRRYGGAVRYVRHEKNRSAFQARNTGVRLAAGDYIVPVDPDDYLLPEVLARARPLIEAERPDVVVYRMEYDAGRRIRPHWFAHKTGSIGARAALGALAEGKLLTGVACKIIRRDTFLAALEALHLPDDAYLNSSDDYLVLMGVLLLSRKMSFLDYVGYRYFMHGSSTSHTWATADGLENACRQTRLANDAIRAMAHAKVSDPSVLKDVDAIAMRMERWFVQQTLEGPSQGMAHRLGVLMRHFDPVNVGLEIFAQYALLRESLAYRIGCRLAAPARFCRGVVSSLFK